jgi:hypothetical protein
MITGRLCETPAACSVPRSRPGEFGAAVVHGGMSMARNTRSGTLVGPGIRRKCSRCRSWASFPVEPWSPRAARISPFGGFDPAPGGRRQYIRRLPGSGEAPISVKSIYDRQTRRSRRRAAQCLMLTPAYGRCDADAGKGRRVAHPRRAGSVDRIGSRFRPSQCAGLSHRRSVSRQPSYICSDPFVHEDDNGVEDGWSCLVAGLMSVPACRVRYWRAIVVRARRKDAT